MSHNSPSLLRLLASAAMVCSLTMSVAGAKAAEVEAGWSIDQLMRTLAKNHNGYAHFVEKKSIAMLDQPVESSGELFYTAPDHLEKRTLKPKLETMILDGRTLTLERGKQKHRLQLQDYPEIAAFIDSIRGTLAGDSKALQQTYQLSLQGDAQDWTLLLLPIDAKMKKIVQSIRINGANGDLRTIQITQADGDSSVMTIEKITTP
ncbi:LolA-related protein [Methylovorus sp. MM2]|uniref:LolA-related protein n=1 Tax=Methylovorus sp. MM2 TaxID=1848038 RepID=UPI000B13D527|nr:LolA-related protein [Methylovorus sp. MM2]